MDGLIVTSLDGINDGRRTHVYAFLREGKMRKRERPPEVSNWEGRGENGGAGCYQ